MDVVLQCLARAGIATNVSAWAWAVVKYGVRESKTVSDNTVRQ